MIRLALAALLAAPDCGALVTEKSVTVTVRNAPPPAADAFYVAPGGDDAGPGTLAAPFKTIQRAADAARAGQTVYIRAGVYRESVRVTASGTGETARVTFRPYNAETVVVSGADPVSGWSRYANAGDLPVYRAAMPWTLAAGENQVFVSGQMMTEARWPDQADYRDLSHPTKALADSGVVLQRSGPNDGDRVRAEIGVPGLPGRSALTGGAIPWAQGKISIVSGRAWWAQTGDIVSAAAGKLVYDYFDSHSGALDPIAANRRSQHPYFIANLFELLDHRAEWFRKTDGYLYLWAPDGQNPGARVEAKRRAYAFDLSGRSYVTIQGLRLFAATIKTDAASRRCLLQGLDVRYPSHFTYGSDTAGHSFRRTDSGVILDGAGNELRDSVVGFSAGNGVALLGSNTGGGNVVANNVIHNTSYAGLDIGAITVSGSGHRIVNNTIAYAGRSLILHPKGIGLSITRNDLSEAGLQTADLGATYTYGRTDGVDGGGTEISYNRVRSVHNDVPGGGNHIAVGIYLDDGSSDYRVHHNDVAGVSRGILLNNPSRDNQVHHNTMSIDAGGRCFDTHMVSCPRTDAKAGWCSWNGSGSGVNDNRCAWAAGGATSPPSHDKLPLPGMAWSGNTPTAAGAGALGAVGAALPAPPALQ